MSKFFNTKLALILVLIFMIPALSCSRVSKMITGKDEPEEISMPSDPIERAAVQGLVTSYKESTMWQIQKVDVLGISPMAPTGTLVELQDPKEVYCVCLQYDARYKVTWATTEGSPWEKTVRNILVIKTQGDQFMPMRPMNVCNPLCG